ncbi:MAG: histidine kinase [Bacillota bacterium]|nr:histidine kinase [Bacillota bacterium]
MKLKFTIDQVKNKSYSIRSKWLIYFTLGVLLTLIIAYITGYYYMYSAVEELNTDSIQSDFAQIDLGLDNLYTNITRFIISTSVAPFTRTLYNHNWTMDANLVYAMNDFKDSINDMIVNFPYIHSAYLFRPDGRIYGVTRTNARFFLNDWKPASSAIVKDRILSYSRPDIALIGGLTTADYPLPYLRSPSSSIISVVYCINEAKLVLNIYASQFESCYSGIGMAENCTIYLLTENGSVLSSLNRDRIGETYEYFPMIHTADFNNIMIDGRQLLSRKNTNTGLTVVVELSSSKIINKFKFHEQIMLLIILCGLLITCYAFDLWMRKALSPMSQFIQNMQLAGRGEYGSRLPEDGEGEIAVLASNYNRMLDNIEIMKRDNQRAEKEKIESELAVLRNQINPHFLYNALNNIKWMAIISGNQDISSNIKALAEFIVPMFKGNSPFCTLNEEIHSISLYCDIMNQRFGGGVSVRFDIDHNADFLLVPRFILQPIIENCFTHAFVRTDQESMILIQARRTEMGLNIMVEDNGAGMLLEDIVEINDILAAGEVDKGIGLTNSNRRIRLHYGASFGIRLAPRESGKGLIVNCLIPIHN